MGSLKPPVLKGLCLLRTEDAQDPTSLRPRTFLIKCVCIFKRLNVNLHLLPH